MRPISAVEVATYLKGIDFPKSKRDVIECAEENNARQELIDFLEKLPDRQYKSMADVEHEVGVLR
ncbi:MAG: DUF2795 domain-containing protein [Armatimonadetes bacterium]|nr:DUF2795 domain-containing protein [Armatimonadota bacterium]